MKALQSCHALVTGGGSGVGAAIARTLAAYGATVTITGRHQQALDIIAAESTKIHTCSCDVTDQTGFCAAIDQITQTNGGIDIAIANAGIAASSPFERSSVDELAQMLDVNVKGVFNTWQLTAPHMLQEKSGRLMAIASMAGLQGYAYTSSYCASKHAVIGLMRALALEYARKGITVNALCPGFVDTPMLARSIDNIVKLTGRSREQARADLAATNRDGKIIAPQQIADQVLELIADDTRTGEAVEL
jgi:NAD(P)-dependent dehydrogenase (short-subunit alcohol dehydrogenase family)